ncbi:helix-turn-helix domain-containing protein [Bacteroidota bacterium]
MKTNTDQEPGSLRIKDKKFLDDTIADIRNNLDRDKYSVDEMASNLNISRSQLYNKIHSSTGMSPKTLIRNIRLEEAKVLLKKGNHNVAEVSYQVGFSSPTYFNKCFNEYFGYPPGEIHKIKTESIEYADTLDLLIKRNAEKHVPVKDYKGLLLKVGIGILAVIVTSVVLIDILSDNKKGFFSRQSIAVLPFDDVAMDPKQTYFAEGIGNAILENLARIEEFKVISRSSVDRFRNDQTTNPEIAGALGVSYLVKGNIQKIGDKINVNIHLIDAMGDKRIWSKNYDQEYHEIFQMQSDITSSVADQLRANITPDELSDINKVPTLKIESYDQFQRGRPHFISYILNQKQKDYDMAMEYFSRALAIDSTHSQVYPHIAELFWIRTYRKDYYNQSFMDTVRQLCEKALDLDPNLAYAYSILGQYYWETGKPVKGISSLEKALSLNSSFSDAHFHLGTYYSWMGEWEKGLPHLYASVELDPFSVFIPIRYGRIAVVYLDICDFDKVDMYASRALDLTGDNNPASSFGYFLKTQSRIVTGRWEEAMEYSEKLIACNSIPGLRYQAEITSHYLKKYMDAINLFEHLESIDQYHANYKQRYAYALWMNGDQQKANELFDEQISQYERGMDLGRIGRHDPRYNLAGIQAFRGNTEAAMELLKDYQFQSGLEYYVTIDPLFENLWSNQKFQIMVKKVREEKSQIRARISKKYPEP